jgi:hypothetical protein
MALFASLAPEAGVEGMRRFAKALRQDAPLHFAIYAYILFAALTSALLGREYLVPIVTRYVVYWSIVATCVVAICAVASLAGHSRDGEMRPVPGAPVPELAARAVLFIGLAAFMGAFTTVKTLIPAINPFWADELFAEADRVLHFGVDPWRFLQPLLGAPPVTRGVEAVYRPIWLAVTAVLPAWMALGCPDPALRARFLASFLGAWLLNGTILAVAFSSGGPVYYGLLTGDGDRFDGLVAQIKAAGRGPYSAAVQQQELWAVHAAAGPAVGAGISAFPSLHVTMAVLSALAGAQVSRPLGIALWLYAGAILVGSVHLGWHYAVDGYVAVATTLLIWRFAGRWAAGRERVSRSAPTRGCD